MPTTRRAARTSSRRAVDDEREIESSVSARAASERSMEAEADGEEEDDDARASGTPGDRDVSASVVTASDGELSPVIEDAWAMVESPSTEAPSTQTPPMRVSARVAAIEEKARGVESQSEEDNMGGLETPERDVTSMLGEEDDCDDDVMLGGTPEGTDEDEEEEGQKVETNGQQNLLSPEDRFRRSDIETRHRDARPGGIWASIGSPMTTPFQARALGGSIDAGATPKPSAAAARQRAKMRQSLPAQFQAPMPISRQVAARIDCLGPSLNIVQRMMLVVGILLDFYSKTQLIRELMRFAHAGSWVWFSFVLVFFVFSAMCITGYWVLHYPMPPKPEPGSEGKQQKVFGFSKYDFKRYVRRFGALCATLQLGTAFAAWRALRTNDLRARKAEMDLRGMQLVDTIFLTLPMATLQAYIGMTCSSPANVCPGRDGFDVLLFFAVAGSITSGTLCFLSLDLHEKPPTLTWKEYWKVHRAHLSEMIAKGFYRFFELAARVCTIGLFAAVTGPYVMLVFFVHACIILGLIKYPLSGVPDRKVWERFWEVRPFKIFGRVWKLPVLDDIKLLVACLIWPPSSYVSNATDRKGKFWWRSTSCPRKSFWALTREDALIPFAVVLGVLAFEAGIMLIIISLIAEEHYYMYLSIAVMTNFLWLISAVNWMSAAALWNPFVPEGPPLGYPSVSAINSAIGNRQLFAGVNRTPMKSPGSNTFARSPMVPFRSPLQRMEENKASLNLGGAQKIEELTTPVLGAADVRKSDSSSESPSLGPRTVPVMLKGSPRPVEVYVDMGDDSAELTEVEEETNPMVVAALGEEAMLRTSLQWRDSMDLDRTMSGDVECGQNMDDLEAAREALNAVAALNTTEEFDGDYGATPNFGSDTPNLASPSVFMDKENNEDFQETPEMGDGPEMGNGASPIFPVSPVVHTSGGYSPR